MPANFVHVPLWIVRLFFSTHPNYVVMKRLLLLLILGSLFSLTACTSRPGGKTLAGSSQTASGNELDAELAELEAEENSPAKAGKSQSEPEEEAVVAKTKKPTSSTNNTSSKTKSSATSTSAAKSKTSKKKAVWQPVVKLSGTKNRKTKPFKVNADEWKIKWKTKPGKGEFIIILHDRNSDFTEIITTTDEAETNFQTMRDGGEYYLQIESQRPYEISVEEYR